MIHLLWNGEAQKWKTKNKYLLYEDKSLSGLTPVVNFTNILREVFLSIS